MNEKLSAEFLETKEVPDIAYGFADKTKDQDEVFQLLHTYPENFLHGLFEEDAKKDWDFSNIVIAKSGDKISGCLFFNPVTNEFTWLAVSPDIKEGKAKIARKLFETVFTTLQPGSEYFWYVNTEDSTYEGYPKLGEYFEPARRLYKKMGVTFTREENKFGKGAHAYRVDGQIPE